MAESRFAHTGHVSDAPMVATSLPGVAEGPACCVGRPAVVVINGERLLKVMASVGMSAEKLALASGVSVETISRLERGMQDRCHWSTRSRVAAALGLHPRAITADGSSAGTVTAAARRPDSGDPPLLPGWAQESAFNAAPELVVHARAFVRGVLADCPLAETAVLLCSELSTNAVQHSASARLGGRFTVRVEIRERDYVWVEVEDEGGPWMDGEQSDERGRGLLIVAGMADHWDVRGDDEGRVVGVRLDWPR